MISFDTVTIYLNHFYADMYNLTLDMLKTDL